MKERENYPSRVQQIRGSGPQPGRTPVGLCLTLLTAAVLWSTASPVLSQPQEPPPPKSANKVDVLTWSEKNLTLTGWTYLNHSTTVVRFVSKPYPGEGEARVRIKLRAERFSGHGADGERSLFTEVEMDCARHRSKILATNYFSLADLRGLISQRTAPDAWRNPDGTSMSEAFAAACGQVDDI